MGSPPTQRAPAEGSARVGAAVAGIAGVVLVISLFFDWYSFSAGGAAEAIDDILGETPLDSNFANRFNVTGWEAFSLTDFLCASAGALAAIRGVLAFTGPHDNPPVPGPLLVTGVGAAALLAVVYRLVDPPSIGFDPKIAAFVGVLAAAGVVYGSAIALREARNAPVAPADRPPV